MWIWMSRERSILPILTGSSWRQDENSVSFMWLLGMLAADEFSNSQASLSDVGSNRLVYYWTGTNTSRYTHPSRGRSLQFRTSLLSLTLIGRQFTTIIETPIFLQLSAHESETSPSRTNGEIPVRIFESALGANDDLNIGDENGKANGFKFVELKYTVETGEAERIAVDGAAKAGEEDGSGGSACEWRLSSPILRMADSALSSGDKSDDAEECRGDAV
jgi:hypothetical protein